MSDVLTTATPTTDLRPFGWVGVVDLDRIPDERGVAVLVNDDQVAVFRIGALVFAIDHVEPFTHTGVLARGLVGSVADRVFVASPLHKQRFDLRTGECLDVPGIQLRTWRTRVVHGRVELLAR